MRTRWTYEETSIPSATENVFRLLVLFVLAYLFENIAILFFSARPDALALHFGQGFQPSQILTHIFLSGSGGLNGFLNLLFETLILWSFGSELERTWGSNHFLSFFTAGLAGGALLSGVVSYTLLPGMVIYGFGAGVASVMVGYAILWPDRRALFFFFFPIRMKWLILILLLLMGFMGPREQMVLYSGGAFGGAIFLYYYVKKGRLYGYKSPSSTSLLVTMQTRIRERVRKRKLDKKRREIEKRIHMKDEVDRLLDKISKEGITALTKKEKEFLDSASREL